MKKYFLFWTLALFITSMSTCAQASERDMSVSGKGLNLRKPFKAQNPAQDKTEIVDITGMGGATFAVSNKADGSQNSFRHSLRIAMELQPSNNTKGKFQIIFYSETEDIPYAVTEENGLTSVYYPEITYDGIKQRLEQAFASRKKVQLKIIQKTDGYREGSLIF